MNKTILLFTFFIACTTQHVLAQTPTQGNNDIYHSTIADSFVVTDSPTRISAQKDTLYVLNDPIGKLLRQIWTNSEVTPKLPAKTPTIIIVDTFDAIDQKKIAFKPSTVK